MFQVISVSQTEKMLESEIASFQQCIFLLTKLRKQLLLSESKDVLVRQLFESGIYEKVIQVFDVCETEHDEVSKLAIYFTLSSPINL